jgi:hypothetical protein
MRTTVKKNLIIFHKLHEWESVRRQLVAEYGISIMISWKMKRDLGFTIRYHKGLVPHSTGDDTLISDAEWRYHYEEQVHLDFFNEETQSWFQLKYLIG